MSYCKIETGLIKRVYSYFIIALFSHWLFQGLLYMDRYERGFKILTEILAFSVIMFIFRPITVERVVFVALVAHTINFLFNGHFWGLAKHYGLCRTDTARLTEYTISIKNRLINYKCFSACYIFGSFARGELGRGSDLDVRLVRNSGFANGVISSMLIARERTLALIGIVPLDIYVCSKKPELREEPFKLF